MCLLTKEQKADTSLQEILKLNRELIAMDTVVVTPHIAFDTKEAKEEITDITLKNIQAFIKGTPVNEVKL
jgi:phosphoglycerate dehydrogenase-like enzyme